MRICFITLLLVPFCLAACDQTGEEFPLAGGDTTIIDRSSHAYDQPAPNLNDEDRAAHMAGDAIFESKYVSSPAPRLAGLGPLFNNNSCRMCHIGDGRGLPVAGQGPLGSHLLVRVSVPDGEPADPGGPIPWGDFGTQLQDHAIHGHTPEVTVLLDWLEITDEHYADGSPYPLRAPHFDIRTMDGKVLPSHVMTSPRIPPPVFGLGLLEAIPEADLIALADPDDADGDGISGRINHVWDPVSQRVAIGRFGWKANVSNLRHQVAAAYGDDMGISSPIFPDADGHMDIDDAVLDVVTIYVQSLAVPQRIHWRDPTVMKGEQRFREIGCSGCHVEAFRTGDHVIDALRNQTIHPYTDLLVHDMGPGLADNRPDFQASGSEWRTAPLWGIGLVQTVLSNGRYLHDGRARTLEEAILWHGGEAEASKEAFRTMSANDRESLLAFLRSL